VHGHTPVYKPYADHRRVAVDTGAYASGALTAARFEGEELSFLTVNAPARPGTGALTSQLDAAGAHGG
jgi:serine/threonine protein phosphatase 1